MAAQFSCPHVSAAQLSARVAPSSSAPQLLLLAHDAHATDGVPQLTMYVSLRPSHAQHVAAQFSCPHDSAQLSDRVASSCMAPQSLLVAHVAHAAAGEAQSTLYVSLLLEQ